MTKATWFQLTLLGILLLVPTLKFSLADEAHHKPSWSYDGKSGPKHWGELDPSFSMCSQGKAQSPINLQGGIRKELPKIKFNYRPSPLHIVNNGHTIQFNYEKGSTVQIGSKTYELLQFHFHTPSEHKISGKSYPLEVHLVHQDSQGKLAVIGVLIDEGTKHPFLSILWTSLPSHSKKEEKLSQVLINAEGLLPSDTGYFKYSGSLTTPPCSEDVAWHVMTRPIEISEAQVLKFQSFFDHNARPVQSINDRFVLYR